MIADHFKITHQICDLRSLTIMIAKIRRKSIYNHSWSWSARKRSAITIRYPQLWFGFTYLITLQHFCLLLFEYLDETMGKHAMLFFYFSTLYQWLLKDYQAHSHRVKKFLSSLSMYCYQLSYLLRHAKWTTLTTVLLFLAQFQIM